MNKMQFRVSFFVKLSLLFLCSVNFSKDLKKKKKAVGQLSNGIIYLIICNEILFPKSWIKILLNLLVVTLDHNIQYIRMCKMLNSQTVGCVCMCDFPLHWEKFPQSQTQFSEALGSKRACSKAWYSTAKFILLVCFSTSSKTQDPKTWRLYVCDIHIQTYPLTDRPI